MMRISLNFSFENYLMCYFKKNLKEIFQQVKLGLRPSLESNICSKEISDLLKKCWSESLSERPEFTSIRDITRRNTKLI